MQSKKESDANEILNRIYTMYSKLPAFIQEWQPAVQTFGHIKFTRNRSHIIAVPEGANHVRGFTATGAFSDEICFQSDVELVMAAITPALGKTGWFCGVSSASPSYAELLIFDKI